jgi:hypothetical protein
MALAVTYGQRTPVKMNRMFTLVRKEVKKFEANNCNTVTLSMGRNCGQMQ